MTPRGGKCEGSGRPPKGRKQYQILLEPGLAEWALDAAKARGLSRSNLVSDALETLRANQNSACDGANG